MNNNLPHILLFNHSAELGGANVVLLGIIDSFYNDAKITLVLPNLIGWVTEVIATKFPKVDIILNPFINFEWLAHKDSLLSLNSLQSSLNFLNKKINLKEISWIISNTLLCFDGTLLAAQHKIKHTWVIHETLTTEFFSNFLPLNLLNYYVGFSSEIITVNDLSLLIHPNKKMIPNAEISPIKIKDFIDNPNEIAYNTPQYINIGAANERKNQWMLLDYFSHDQITFFFDRNWPYCQEYLKKCPIPLEKLQTKVTFNTLSAIKNSKAVIQSSLMETGPLVALEAGFVNKPCLHFVSNSTSEKMLMNNYYYKANPHFLWSNFNELGKILSSDMKVNPMKTEIGLCSYLKTSLNVK